MRSIFIFALFSLTTLAQVKLRGEVVSLAPPSTFSCLSDLLMLRSEVVDRSMQGNRFPGKGVQRKKFKQDHQGMERLVRPSPFFPYHVMKQLQFYREKLLPAYKYLVKHDGLEVASESHLMSLSGELFYQFIFSRGKDDLALLKNWEMEAISPRFSDYYQNLKGVQQRASYFTFCSTLFQEDVVSSPNSTINQEERNSRKSVVTPDESDLPSNKKGVLP